MGPQSGKIVKNTALNHNDLSVSKNNTHLLQSTLSRYLVHARVHLVDLQQSERQNIKTPNYQMGPHSAGIVRRLSASPHLGRVLQLGVVSLQLERGRQERVGRPRCGVQVDLFHELESLCDSNKTRITH